MTTPPTALPGPPELDALKAQLAQLDALLAEGVLRVLGKGSKERLVPFGEEAHAWLRRYLAEARPAILGARASDALFVTVRGEAMTRQMFWNLVKRYALRGGITAPLSPHTLQIGRAHV